jgi:hypothetical protein
MNVGRYKVFTGITAGYDHYTITIRVKMKKREACI